MVASADTRAAIAIQLSQGALLVGRTPAHSKRYGWALPDSEYVDRFWCPVVGPSVTQLMRWLQWRLPEPDQLARVEAEELSEALGWMDVGKVARVVARAVSFGCGFRDVAPGLGTATWFRSDYPILNDQRVSRLSPGLQMMHVQMLRAAAQAEYVEVTLPPPSPWTPPEERSVFVEPAPTVRASKERQKLRGRNR